MLTPVLALITWTLVIWGWMYATRIPAMQKAKIDPQSAIHPGSLETLPDKVRVVADNYNHLHEQPTIFYALCLYTHLAGVADALTVGLAWAYVALRVVHSVVQIIVRRVTLRFFTFVAGTLCLIAIAAHDLLALANSQ
jgi:hypothetical protein